MAAALPPPTLDSGVFAGLVASDSLSIPRGYRGAKQRRTRRANTPDEKTDSKTSPSLLIVSIIITLIIFITLIAYFELVREKLVYERTLMLAESPLVAETQKEKERIALVADQSYSAARDFAIVITIMAFILLPILFWVYQKL